MPAEPPTPDELRAMTGHIAYEVAAMEYAYARRGGDRLATEAFLLHVRLLREFFWGRWDPESRFADADVFAENYFTDVQRWRERRGNLLPTLDRTRTSLDRQLAHITRHRIADEATDFDAAAPELLAEIQKEWQLFLDTLGGSAYRGQFIEVYGRWKARLGE